MQTWTRYTTAGDRGRQRPTDSVELGPGEVEGLDRRLLGDVSGMRILDLGAGAGHSAIALAKQGARVVAIDANEGQVAVARAASEEAEVHVEVHHADLADLAFLHADIFDAVIAVHSLAAIADVGRVFRQTHRLLKTDRPLVLSLPHPTALMLEAPGSNTLATSYTDTEPLGEGSYLTHRHGTGHIFTQLNRANYRVDTLFEPRGDDLYPASVIFRARKIGN
jgi:2-polyprenyl-3-methyl-5-hydroxy-6-metoxy-1,4-benzoquinol methylase